MDMFEMLMAKSLSGGGGAAPTLITKDITANGSYAASDDDADGYSAVSVDVANTYTAQDEGKVVSNGALVAQTSTNATANGTIDTTTNNEVVVNVPNTYTAGDEGKVVSSGALVAQTAYPSTITDNGTYDTTLNNSVIVNVPTYSSADNGKVIKNGALTAQTAYGTVTSNGTYNTTYNKSIVVNVSSNSAAIPLTTTNTKVNNFNAFVVKNNSSLYIFGTIYITANIIGDLVCKYDSNIDISALDGTSCGFKAYPSGSSLLNTTVHINTVNKTLTFSASSGYFDASKYAMLS